MLLLHAELSGEVVALSNVEKGCLEAELANMFRHGAVSTLSKIRYQNKNCLQPRPHKYAEKNFDCIL